MANFTGAAGSGAFLTSTIAGDNTTAFKATIGTDGYRPQLNHRAGEIAFGDDNSKWVFVKASAAISQYDAVHIDELYNAQPLTSTLALTYKMIGFAQIAFSQYDMGWVALEGENIGVNVISACNSGVWLCTSATAGKLNSTYTTFIPLQGISIATTIAATGRGTAIIQGAVRPQLRTSGV